MTLYEVTLEGFDPARDDNDYLIKWVEAPNAAAVWDLESICRELGEATFREVRPLRRRSPELAAWVDAWILEKGEPRPEGLTPAIELPRGRKLYINKDQDWLGLGVKAVGESKEVNQQVPVRVCRFVRLSDLLAAFGGSQWHRDGELDVPAVYAHALLSREKFLEVMAQGEDVTRHFLQQAQAAIPVGAFVDMRS